MIVGDIEERLSPNPWQDRRGEVVSNEFFQHCVRLKLKNTV